MSKHLQLLVCFSLLAWAGCPDEEADDDTADDDNADDDASDDDSAATDSDGDGWSADDDCDDGDAAVHPGAEEGCDGKDSDCDGVLPEDEQDSDGDGWPLCGGECDDENAAVYPGAEEVCDLVDNDCDADTPAEQHCNPRPLDTADAIFRGETDWDQAGYSVAFAGDVNADGYDDVLIGAPEDDLHHEGYGHSMLYYGPCEGEIPFEEADVVFRGERITDGSTGVAVAAAGDTNADGYDDILITADLGSSLFLGPVPEGEHDSSDGDAFFDSIGGAFAAMGDTNGDGYDDVLMSGNESVAVVLFTGPLAGVVDAGMADATFIGDVYSDWAGKSVANAGDVNADGDVDYLIGAPHTDAGESWAGAAYLAYGPVLGDYDLANADATVVGEDFNGWLGYSTAGAGDVNGDGYDDVMVGSDRGSVYLFLGPVLGLRLASEANSVLSVDPSYGGIEDLATAGDLGGDGFDEILLSTPRWNGGNLAYLVSGPIDSGSVILGEESQIFYSDSGLGSLTVAGGGDVDGDGTLDVLIGAEGSDDVFLFYTSRLFTAQFAPLP